jgi:hypothetical protein
MARPLAGPARVAPPPLASKNALAWLTLLALTVVLMTSDLAPWAF